MWTQIFRKTEKKISKFKQNQISVVGALEHWHKNLLTNEMIFLHSGGGQGGGSPGEQGAGGVRETGEERAGSGILKKRNFQKASFRYLLMLIIQSKKRPQQHFLTSI